MRRAWWAFLAAAAAVVWLATDDLSIGPQLLVVFLLVVLPALLSLQAAIADDIPEGLSRLAIYGTSAVALLLLAGGTYAIARAAGFGTAALGLVSPPAISILLWGAGITAAGLAVQLAALTLGETESAMLLHILPRTGTERTAFAALSICAGTCEELVYRGFLLTALTTTTGSVLAAALLSSAAFGVLHAYQRGSGALRAGVLGLLLTVPVIATGSVIPSMVAHTALDLVGGIFAQRLFRR